MRCANYANLLGRSGWLITTLFSIQLASAETWVLVDLGVGQGLDINASGQVVGDHWGRAFLWADGVRSGLGSLGGDPEGWCVPYGINDVGQVTGESRDANYLLHAFLWEDDVWTDLGALPGSTTARASAINNLAQLAGRDAPPNDPYGRAFLWDGGVMTELGLLPGTEGAQAWGINNGGQVVGWCRIPTLAFGCLWDNGTVTELGSLGGSTTVYDINDAGQVVGRSHTSGGQERPFLWENGTMTDLGILPGAVLTPGARAINELGQVVGMSGGHAFLWQAGVMVDLNDLIEPGSGWELRTAWGINDATQIVGRMTDAVGQNHAFLLRERSGNRLTISVSNPCGTVDADPDAPGYDYDPGTEVTLTAQTSGDNNFEEWHIYNPNYPGDANYAVTDSNNPITIAMDSDREVEAVFACDPSLYTLIDLGPGQALDINASGQVVGDKNGLGFLWADGVMSGIGSLSGDPAGWCVPYGINDVGQVTGESRDANYLLHAFVWEAGVWTDLGALPGSSTTRGSAINNAGQVVGRDSPPGHPYGRAFLWEAGVMTELGLLPGTEGAQAWGINNLGQAAGWCRIPTAGLGCLWDSGTVTDLGSLGGSTTVYDINDAGQVVGRSHTSGGQERPFLWENGVMTDLGILPGAVLTPGARAINELGQVVGMSGGHAFLWQNGVMTDLNDLIYPGSGWELHEAWGINDAGQIVGRMTDAYGQSRAYLLIPPSAPMEFLLALTIESGTPMGGSMGSDGETSAPSSYGYVELDPYVPEYVYPAGTEVTLHAVPYDRKVFKRWKIHDPLNPGDANYVTKDGNNPITIVMSGQREVTAIFKRKCGSGVEQALPALAILGAFCGVAAWRRRR